MHRMIVDLIFIAAAVGIIVIGQVYEHRLEDETWGKVKRWKQEVARCYRKLLIRHRSPYCEIGCYIGRRR
ncbi:MAG: hypothetical protein IKS31_01510 [Clostridia bacterium]|nr:hypothetical protein [Clostridia bacterium]